MSIRKTLACLAAVILASFVIGLAIGAQIAPTLAAG